MGGTRQHVLTFVKMHMSYSVVRSTKLVNVTSSATLPDGQLGSNILALGESNREAETVKGQKAVLPSPAGRRL
jgi:hypothetical protein